MSILAKTIVSSTLCLVMGAASFPGLSAQTVGTSRTRIPGDANAARLNDLLSSAQEATNRKDYASAEQNYKSYLAEKPEDATAHFQLGYTYTAWEKPNDAKAEYEKAISLDPQMAPAYQNLGLTLLPSDPSAAVAPLQKAADLIPEQGRPKYLLGAALEFSGRLEAAIEQYQQAEKLDARDFEVHAALGRALLKTNRPSDAELEFRAALVLRPDSGPTHWGIAQCLRLEKKRDVEATELAAYLQTAPEDRAARVERAEALADLGKNDEALAELDRAAAQKPEDLTSLQVRSQILLTQKRYDDEAQALEKAAALAPQDPNIRALLGHTYLQERDYANAAKELSVAYKMKPDASDTLGDLALAEYGSANYAAALEAFDALSKQETLPAGAWFMQAVSYEHLGRKPEALGAYQKFLAANPDHGSDMYFEATARQRKLTHEIGKR